MTFFSKLIFYSEYRAKREALYRLRCLPDRQLIDCGISPELLKEGISAWPWREISETYKTPLFTLPTSRNKTHCESNAETCVYDAGAEENTHAAHLDAA